jgi:uncharacterized membrane protein YkgB
MAQLEMWSLRIGKVVLRYSLVLFFLGFGILKFTPDEALAIHPPNAHSPLQFWLDALLGQQGSSNVIGVIEIALALLIAVRPFAPRLAALGGFGTAFALLITLSFLVTTPQLDPGLAAFIIKDVTLFGAALWSAGEALGAAQRGMPAQPAVA